MGGVGVNRINRDIFLDLLSSILLHLILTIPFIALATGVDLMVY